MCKVSTGFFLPMIIQQLSFPFFAMPLGGGGGDQGTVGDHIVENHRTHQKGKERIFSFPIF